jgi:hypothetical protein
MTAQDDLLWDELSVLTASIDRIRREVARCAGSSPQKDELQARCADTLKRRDEVMERLYESRSSG